MKTGSFSCHELVQAIQGCRRRHPEVWAQFVATNPRWCKFKADVAGERKAALLAMPEGSPRPNQKTHPLGRFLTQYTCKGGGSYDPEFDKAARKRHQQWFISESDVANGKKATLLSLPRGCRRPRRVRGELGIALASYTNKRNGCYDAGFDKKARVKYPQWFGGSNASKGIDRKRQLMRMPSGSKKPGSATPLGATLYCATKKGGPCYDAQLDAHMRVRHPGWFSRPRLDTATRKAMLLAMPAGCRRPKVGHGELGEPLRRYTTPGGTSYDGAFDKAIRKKHAQWFIPMTERSRKNKETMLAMPSGSDRPAKGTRLLTALLNYISKGGSSYDAEFTRAVKARHANWFPGSGRRRGRD